MATERLGRMLLAGAMVSIIALAGCAEKRRTDLHHERAHDLMMQARAAARADSPEDGLDYTDDVWMQVIEELSQVDQRFAAYDQDMALLEEIKAARADAFADQALARHEEETRRDERRRELDQRIDRILSDPFARGGRAPDLGDDPSEGGRYEVILSKVGSDVQGGTYVVRGEVLNVSGRTLGNPLVMVDFLDGRGRVMRTSQAMIEPLTIPHMGGGSFVVTTDARGVESWRLRMRELAGDRLSFKSPDPERPDPGQ